MRLGKIVGGIKPAPLPIGLRWKVTYPVTWRLWGAALPKGFPITYQFYGRSFAEKLKMIGNAIPPTFSYILASLARGQDAQSFVPHSQAGVDLALPIKKAPKTGVDTPGKTYPTKRRFRAAIPELRFKSGMRFEFANEVSEARTTWSMRFYSGNSKEIRTHNLEEDLGAKLRQCLELQAISVKTHPTRKSLENLVSSVGADELQQIWTRRARGLSPYHWVDLLGELSNDIHDELLEALTIEDAERIVLELVGQRINNGKFENEAKLKRYAHRIISGAIVGVWFNRLLAATQMSEAA